MSEPLAGAPARPVARWDGSALFVVVFAGCGLAALVALGLVTVLWLALRLFTVGDS